MTDRKPRAPRKPRDPLTRRTPLAHGQVWTVALGTVDGAVRRADYRRYMRSSEWAAKRNSWWANVGRPTTCAACAASWSISGGDVHHRSYEHLGYERDDELIQLCRTCHDEVHERCRRWSQIAEVTDAVIAQIRARSAA